MIKIEHFLNEIEFCESKKFYKLADKLTNFLIKTSAEAKDFKGFQEILDPLLASSQIKFLNEVCPDIMNDNASIQQYSSFKDYLLEKMKSGVRPKDAWEQFARENEKNIQGKFKSCFENAYAKITGYKPSPGQNSLDFSQGSDIRDDKGNALSSPETRQTVPM